MPIQKIKSGRIITVTATNYIGDKGIIFYDEDTPELRLSNGTTPGGILITGFSLLPASNTTLGGVKIGNGLNITIDGTLSAVVTSTYLLVTATNTQLGGVKIGSGLSVTGDGTLSAIATSTYVLVTATNTRLGGIKIGAGLAASNDGTVSVLVTSTYTLPVAGPTILGGIKIGANLTISPDGTLNANTATAGVVQAFKTIKVKDNADIIASSFDDTLEIIGGNGVNIVTSSTAFPYKTITIDAASYLGNIDGGWPDTEYGGTIGIDGGNPFDIFGTGQLINGGGV